MSPPENSNTATPRTVVVTGASSGIGATLARALAERGDRVAIGARRRDRLQEVEDAILESGGSVFAHPLDVTDLESIKDFFAATTDALGPIDVAVNNAGLSIPSWLHESDPEDLAREIATNLLGPMLVSRCVLPAMLEREIGDLVFIGSDNADNPRPQQSGYSAAKAGIKTFCRVLAMELEGTGVRVTHLRLGPTLSEFGFAWSQETMASVIASWQPFGLTRNMAFMEASMVADAVIHALDAPRSASFANIELQPTAPPRSSQ
ncbi:MAG: SDR family NAD(P)-dependent oxidoreductase [Deltaproteobacteria bacterium]|nr:SDR family NAD(P)-dependent oxidoreductase [Deltaproteobacteria bacterium]MBW2725258.1 SDR family NAD(P)-dependent oxidoreductase [Deltaproteobacteria bacterium]